MKLSKLTILLLFFSLLYGCASLNKAPTEYGMPLTTHHLPWKDRYQQLSALQNWTAQGNAAAHSDTKGWNASYNWQQTGDQYTLQLFGPLGFNRIILDGSPSQATLRTMQASYSAANATALLQQQTGWQLPVSDLSYWLKGLPAPHDTHFKRSLDINNHLVNLYQHGWQVTYLRYVSVNGTDLPDRILLRNPQWQVHVVITHWQLGQ